MILAKLKKIPFRGKIALLLLSILLFDSSLYLLVGDHYWTIPSFLIFIFKFLIFVVFGVTPWFFVVRFILPHGFWINLLGIFPYTLLFFCSSLLAIGLFLPSTSDGKLLKKIEYKETEISIAFHSGGVTGSAYTTITQERRVFPGLIFRRTLESFEGCYGVDVYPTSEGIRITHLKDGHCEEFKEGFRDHSLKPYVHF